MWNFLQKNRSFLNLEKIFLKASFRNKCDLEGELRFKEK